MGHGSHLGEEHRALADRLQHGSVAMVEPADLTCKAAWGEILETLFTPEDAVLASKLPILPTPLASIADRLGTDPDSLGSRLDELANKGLVMDFPHPRTGEMLYLLAPPMVGLYEFSMMRVSDHLPKEKVANAFGSYLRAEEFVEELSAGATVMGRALAYETVLFDDLLSEVLDWERASFVVESAGKVSITNCACRHKASHVGTVCDAPLETCMSLGPAADYLIRRGLAREISSQQGLEVLAAARDRGLVHIADNVQQDVSYICSCCSCCCEELRSVRAEHSVVVPSGFEALIDAPSCNGCGRCVKRCPVEAISLVDRSVAQAAEREAETGRRTPSSVSAYDGGLDETPDGNSGRPLAVVNHDRCIGCGVCVGTCNRGALALHRRAKQRHVPVNLVEFLTRSMIERGRLADLIVDGTNGRGPAFANAVLRTVLSLPVADRIVASEQLQSRFVRFALSRA